MLTAKGMMKDMSKEDMMAVMDIVMVMDMMILAAIMTITKLDTRRAMRKAMMMVIVKARPILKNSKMKKMKMIGSLFIS